jgi:hypothetical protein
MKKNFYATDWKDYLPRPVCEAHPEYNELYNRAWELARDHVKTLPGMPQNPYMDEGFCDPQVWIWDTCFMTLFCKFAPEVFPGVETFNNFYDVLYMGGELPEVIPTEAEPWWTGAKPGVPFRVKVHIADNPPLFAWAEYENALMSGDKAYIKATSTSSPGASLKLTMDDGGLNGQGAAMLLGNKSILAAETTDCAIAEGTDCGIIFYTSGWGKASKELITGKDVFKLIVRNNGEVLPYGVAGSGSGTTTTPEDDCKSGGDGTTCAGKIANAGWVKEDYDKEDN